MLRGLVLALVGTLVVLAQPAVAADGDAPAVGTPTIVATTAASASVSVQVDTHNAQTVVQVEYVTAGAYRGRRVPGAATTVTIATVPASAAGPTTVTGQVTGLDPAATYRMRVKASNIGGEGTPSADVTVKTPRAPKTAFKAKVGKKTTRLTRLTVAGVRGGEVVRIRCKTAAKGCPFTSRTITNLVQGTASFSPLLKRSRLEPGAKVTVQVSAYGVRLSALTLVIRDDQQPKVKRK